MLFLVNNNRIICTRKNLFVAEEIMCKEKSVFQNLDAKINDKDYSNSSVNTNRLYVKYLKQNKQNFINIADTNNELEEFDRSSKTYYYSMLINKN